MFSRNSIFRAGRLAALACMAIVALVAWLHGQSDAGENGQPFNAEAAKLKNPVALNAETVETGKKLYQRHCASCHGRSGKGDGGLALSGGEPSDLTDDVWDTGSTDGEIFVAIRDGLSSDMLAYKEKLKDKEIWQVVVFLRSLGPKQPK